MTDCSLEATDTLTPTCWFCLVPLRILSVHALDDHGALLLRVAGVAGELHHGAHAVRRVATTEVAVLDEGLIARPLGESCRAGKRLGSGLI